MLVCLVLCLRCALCCAELLGRRGCHETEGRSALDTGECMEGCCVYVSLQRQRLGVSCLPVQVPITLVSIVLLLIVGANCWRTGGGRRRRCPPETVGT